MNPATVLVALSVFSCSLALPADVFPAPVDRAEDIVTSGTWELDDPTPIITEEQVDGVWKKEAYYTLYHSSEHGDNEVDLTLEGPTYLSGYATVYTEHGAFDGEATVVLPLDNYEFNNVYFGATTIRYEWPFATNEVTYSGNGTLVARTKLKRG